MTDLQVKAMQATEQARHNRVQEELADRENFAKYNQAYTALNKAIDSAHNGNDRPIDVLHKLWFGNDNEQAQVWENFYHNADKWKSFFGPLSLEFVSTGK